MKLKSNGKRQVINSLSLIYGNDNIAVVKTRKGLVSSGKIIDMNEDTFTINSDHHDIIKYEDIVEIDMFNSN